MASANRRDTAHSGRFFIGASRISGKETGYQERKQEIWKGNGK
jgi:hypothetical protein